METTDNLARIRRISRILGNVCLTAAVAVIPLVGLYWAAFNLLPADWTREAAEMAVATYQPGWVRGLCFLAALVSAGPLCLTLLRLRQLFSLYAQGRIFTLANVACFRTLARSLLVWAVASILQTPLSGLAITAANPAGRHMLRLGIGSGELALFFVAAMAVIIARVMDEARRLEEDQALTV